MSKPLALDKIEIDKGNPTPLYYQLQQGIRRAIEEGRLSPGERLPSITDIAKSCGMSNATVVQALSPLAREGLIISRRGYGNVVAEPKQKTTEVIIQSSFRNQPTEKGSFLYQIVEGVLEGYNDPERRITFSHYDHSPVSVRELIEVCRARNADGMVVYRPEDALADTIKTVARRIPTVTLFRRVENSLADCVEPAPAVPLKLLLREYIELDFRKFYYIGPAHLVEKGEACSPYFMIYEEFVRSMSKAGITPDIRLARGNGSVVEKDECKRIAREMPEGAVVVTASPDIVEEGRKAGSRATFITYTESAGSRERMSSLADVIYMGLELLSLRAVELLKTRCVDTKSPQRIMSVEPVIDRIK